MENVLYRRVYIEGKEENLPKEYGGYFVWNRNYLGDELHVRYFFKGDERDDIWLNYIDWYLQPIPREEIIEEMKKMNPYPESVFIPIKEKEMAKVIKLLVDNGHSPDALYGHWGRKVWNNCIDKVDEYLNSK